jgi:predicted unusual protein kinase regulating ubiquinone biosynthesis (AarF/ABC1/UbiB family)
MLLCMLAASPALRLAPPVMQLRQADSASVGTAGFAAGRGVPMMAVEQVKFTGNAVAVDGVVTAMSGNAMEDMWEKSRGRPLRRSLALWLFSMKATWKIIRAHKSEAKQIKVAAWVRDELLRLGPTMIKLGQVASARTDLLSQPYIDALVALQDSVPTISAERVAVIVNDELGASMESVFDTFEMQPLAGASLGQVHRAVYQGQQVAVKVQRRNLAELFDTDFTNIRLMARIGNFFESKLQKKAGVTSRDWLEYTNDAARLLYLEIDYDNEAKNSQRFASSLPAELDIIVPRIYANATTARLLTMEYIDSVKLTDEKALAKLGLDRKKLAKQVVDIFLTQLLRSGVLHCDPHPGNMCVDAKGRLVFYDFGMVDTLSDDTQRGLRNTAFALFGGSADPSVEELRVASRQLVEGVQQMGFVDKAADTMALQKVGAFAVKNFKDQAAGRTTEDVTEKVGGELQGMVDDGVIQFPSIFTFVGRAFASVDGIGRELDPKYDFRAMTEPYVGEIISERYQKDAAAQREAFFGGFQAALGTPARVTYLEETMRAIEAGELTLSSRSLGQERGQKALEKRVAGLSSLLVASTLLNLAIPMVVGPLRKLTFVAAAFFGTKALPALL